MIKSINCISLYRVSTNKTVIINVIDVYEKSLQ